MQTLMFDPGGFKGRLRAYPYLRTWRTLLCGDFFFFSGVFFTEGGPRSILFRSELQAFRTSCGRSLVSPQPGWFKYAMPGYGSWGYEDVRKRHEARSLMAK